MQDDITLSNDDEKNYGLNSIYICFVFHRATIKKCCFSLRLDNKMDENNTNQTNNLFKRYIIICIHKM